MDFRIFLFRVWTLEISCSVFYSQFLYVANIFWVMSKIAKYYSFHNKTQQWNWKLIIIHRRDQPMFHLLNERIKRDFLLFGQITFHWKKKFFPHKTLIIPIFNFNSTWHHHFYSSDESKAHSLYITILNRGGCKKEWEHCL